MKGDCYKSILLALIGIFQFASSFAASDSLLIIQNVSVVDVGTKCIHKNVDIVIEGRIIKRILPFNPDNKYHNAQIINSSGDYCIPGLIDSHVHLDTEPVESLKFLVQNGVTIVRDMAGDAEYLRSIITEIESGSIIGPDIYYSAVMAGKEFIESSSKIKMVTPSGLELGEAPWARKIDDKSDIIKVVKQAKECGAYALKLYKDLTADQVKKLTEEGHNQGLLVWAHATVYPATCDQLIDADIDCISHYPYILCSDNLYGKIDASRTFIDDDIISFRKLEQRLVRMKDRRTFFDPNIFQLNKLIYNKLGNSAEIYSLLGYYAIKRAHELGVVIVAGTDASVVTNDTITLYYELEALVRNVGLTPLEALQSATINGAKVLHIDNIFGSIDPGKIADIVVLSKDPTIDIKGILSIKYVIKNGKILFQN